MHSILGWKRLASSVRRVVHGCGESGSSRNPASSVVCFGLGLTRLAYLSFSYAFGLPWDIDIYLSPLCVSDEVDCCQRKLAPLQICRPSRCHGFCCNELVGLFINPSGGLAREDQESPTAGNGSPHSRQEVFLKQYLFPSNPFAKKQKIGSVSASKAAITSLDRPSIHCKNHCLPLSLFISLFY